MTENGNLASTKVLLTDKVSGQVLMMLIEEHKSVALAFGTQDDGMQNVHCGMVMQEAQSPLYLVQSKYSIGVSTNSTSSRVTVRVVFPIG